MNKPLNVLIGAILLIILLTYLVSLYLNKPSFITTSNNIPQNSQQEEVRKPVYQNDEFKFGFDYPSTYISDLNPTTPSPTSKSEKITAFKDPSTNEKRGFVVFIVPSINDFEDYIENEEFDWNKKGQAKSTENETTRTPVVSADDNRGYILTTYDGTDRVYFPIPESKDVLYIAISYTKKESKITKDSIRDTLLKNLVFLQQ